MPNLERVRTWSIARLWPFLIIIAVGTGLAISVNNNVQNIKNDAVIACRRSNANSESTNKFLDIVISGVRTGTNGTAAQRNERIKQYQSAKQKLQDCDHNGSIRDELKEHTNG
jgi:hypothetical protein